MALSMPALGMEEVDGDAVQLLTRWIDAM